MQPDSNQAIETMRHSFAHVLAQAVLRLYPEAKLGIGPAIPDGFYYEFDLPRSLKVEELPQIEAEMKKIITEALPFKQIIITRQQAFDMLLQLGQIYKTELLQQVPDEQISFYKTGDEFIDLCRGPHVNHTGQLKIFKLIGIAKQNWLGDPARPIMQRIVGVAFASKKELEKYLEKQEELKLNDHTKLGKEIKIFTTDPEGIGTGLPLLLSNGYLLKRELQNFFTEQLSNAGYTFVETPELISNEILKQSRATDYMKDVLLPEIKLGDKSYRLKPAAAPVHFQIFAGKNRGHKEIPLRMAEFSVNYQKKLGLGERLTESLRYTSLSSTTFAKKQYAKIEIVETIGLMTDLIKKLGFNDYKLEVALPYHNRLINYLGDEQSWQESVALVEETLADLKLVAHTKEGEAPYYGPEISIVVRDSFKRDWNLATITPDLVSSKILGLKFARNDGESEAPVIIHKNFITSLEGLMALMIENFSGAFPIWLSPVQVMVVPISEKFNRFAEQTVLALKQSGLRTAVDTRDENMQAKIREAQMLRIPYMLILGEKEVSTNSVSVRPRSGQDLGLMRVEEFVNLINKEISRK
jgi:threonyl-tRNA synthetase